MTQQFLYRASEYATDTDAAFWRSITEAVIDGDVVETRVDHTGTVDVDIWAAVRAENDPATALPSPSAIAQLVAASWIESWGGADTGELHERVEDSAAAPSVIRAADRLRSAFAHTVNVLTATTLVTTATVGYVVDNGVVTITDTAIPYDPK